VSSHPTPDERFLGGLGRRSSTSSTYNPLYAIGAAVAVTVLIAAIEVPYRTKATLLACLNWSSFTYFLILALGNVAGRLHAVPEAQLNVYIEQYLGAGKAAELQQVAAASGSESAHYKAFALAHGNPRAAAAVLKSRR
jgi:hypothetical protein